MADRELFVVDVEAAVLYELEADQQQRLIDTFGAYGFRDYGGDEFRVCLSDSVHAVDAARARRDVADRVLNTLPAGSVVLSLTIVVTSGSACRSHPSNGL